jgi:hypothetical protein
MAVTGTATAAGDILIGDNSDDKIRALAGNDRVFAGGGNDTVWGEAGNDDLDGGDGVDTAAYQDIMADFAISTINGVTFVKHREGKETSWDGNDKVTGFERLSFGDKTALLSNNTGPTANPDTATTAEGVSVVINVLSNDSDAQGDALSIDPNGFKDVVGGTVALVTGGVQFTPAAGFNGKASFVYTLGENLHDLTGAPIGGAATATAMIDVLPAGPPQTVSFTDLPSIHDNGVGSVPDGYMGFLWFVIGGTSINDPYWEPSVRLGELSGDHSAYNHGPNGVNVPQFGLPHTIGWRSVDGDTFIPQSLDIHGYEQTRSMTIGGYVDGQQVKTLSFDVLQTGWWQSFDRVNISDLGPVDEIRVTGSTGDSDHPLALFVVDNFTYIG